MIDTLIVIAMMAMVLIPVVVIGVADAKQNTKGFEMLRERNNWTDVVCNWVVLIMVIIPLMSVAMIGFLAFIVWILGV